MHHTTQPASDTPTGRVVRETAAGGIKPEAHFRPLTPDQVEAIPPWEREECRYHEVPAVLKRKYNFSVCVETVYRWMKKGRAANDGSGKTLYLKHQKKIGRIFVKNADLERFMELT